MSRLPVFSNEDDEAEFWAHHELTEFQEDLTPVEVRAVRQVVVSIRLPQADVEALKKLAADAGVGYTTLARQWIHQRVAAEQRSRSRKVRVRPAPTPRPSTAAARRRGAER